MQPDFKMFIRLRMKSIILTLCLVAFLPNCKIRPVDSSLHDESVEMTTQLLSYLEGVDLSLPDRLRLLDDIRYEFRKANNTHNLLAIIDLLSRMDVYALNPVREIIVAILAQEGLSEDFTDDAYRVNLTPNDSFSRQLQLNFVQIITTNFPTVDAHKWGIAPPQIRQYREALELFVSQNNRRSSERRLNEQEALAIAIEKTQSRFSQSGSDLSVIFSDQRIGPQAERYFNREYILASDMRRPVARPSSFEAAYIKFRDEFSEKLSRELTVRLTLSNQLMSLKALGVAVEIKASDGMTLDIDDLIALYDYRPSLEFSGQSRWTITGAFGTRSHGIDNPRLTVRDLAYKIIGTIEDMIDETMTRCVLLNELDAPIAKKAIAFYTNRSSTNYGYIIHSLPYSNDLLGDLARAFDWDGEFGGASVDTTGVWSSTLLLSLYGYQKNAPDLPRVPLVGPLDKAEVTVELPYQDDKTGKWVYRTPTPEAFHRQAAEIKSTKDTSDKEGPATKAAPTHLATLKDTLLELVNGQFSSEGDGSPTRAESLTFGRRSRSRDRFRVSDDNDVDLIRIPTIEDLDSLTPIKLSEDEFSGQHHIQYDGPANLINGRYLQIALPIFAAPQSIVIRDAEGGVLKNYQIFENSQTSSYFVDVPVVAGRNVSYSVSYNYLTPQVAVGFLESVDRHHLIQVRNKLSSIGEKFLSGRLTHYIESNTTDLVSGRHIERWLQAATKYSLAIPDTPPPPDTYDIVQLASLVKKGGFNMKCDASACALASIFRDLNQDSSFEIRTFVTYSRHAQEYHAQVGVFRDGLREVYDATGSYSNLRHYIVQIQNFSRRIAERGMTYLREIRREQDPNESKAETSFKPADTVDNEDREQNDPAMDLAVKISNLKQSFINSSSLMEFARQTRLQGNIVTKLYQIILRLDQSLSMQEPFEQMRQSLEPYKLWMTKPESMPELLSALSDYALRMKESLNNNNFSNNPRLKDHHYLHLPAVRRTLASYFESLSNSIDYFLDDLSKDVCSKASVQIR